MTELGDADVSQYGPDGPVWPCMNFIDAAFTDDSEAFWKALDDNLKVCLVQQWAYVNRDHPLLPKDLKQEVASIVQRESPLWAHFINTQINECTTAWRSIYEREPGASNRARPLGSDLELVVIMPTDGEVRTFDRPTLAAHLPFAMHSTVDGWTVAAFGDFIPIPGLPPQIRA